MVNRRKVQLNNSLTYGIDKQAENISHCFAFREEAYNDDNCDLVLNKFDEQFIPQRNAVYCMGSKGGFTSS